MKRETTVLTYGTFDVLHWGHVEFLNRARKLGTRLVVGVSTDEFNEKCKSKKALLPFNRRLDLVNSLRAVDLAFAEDSWEQKEADIAGFGASVVVFGEDWKGKFDYLRNSTGAEVVYLPRTPGISSTMIRKMEELDEEGIRAGS